MTTADHEAAFTTLLGEMPLAGSDYDGAEVTHTTQAEWLLEQLGDRI